MEDTTRTGLLERRAVRVPVAVLLVGFTVGCWVGYVLIHSVSSLPLPRFTVVGVVVLGVYVDQLADSMSERLFGVIGAGLLGYVVGFTVYAFPALVGWFTDPLVVRSIYLSGLRETFIFALLGGTLLLAGTFISYVVRNTYEEITR